MGTESLGLYPHEPYIAYLSRLGWLWSTSQWPTSRNFVAFHALDLLHLPNDWDLERWPPTTSYRSGWKTSHDWKGDFVPQFRPQLPMMTSDLPLSGKRVLELGQVIAGPFCGRIPHAIPPPSPEGSTRHQSPRRRGSSWFQHSRALERTCSGWIFCGHANLKFPARINYWSIYTILIVMGLERVPVGA